MEYRKIYMTIVNKCGLFERIFEYYKTSVSNLDIQGRCQKFLSYEKKMCLFSKLNLHQVLTDCLNVISDIKIWQKNLYKYNSHLCSIVRHKLKSFLFFNPQTFWLLLKFWKYLIKQIFSRYFIRLQHYIEKWTLQIREF